MGSFFRDNWGSIVSAVGLVGTFAAIWQATRAARSAASAAQQAQMVRQELAKKTLAEELGNLRHLLEPVILLIETKAPEPASALLRPAQYSISLLISRWGSEMAPAQADSLVRSSTLLKSASKVLSNGNLDTDGYARCLSTTDTALHLVIEAQGQALASVDRLARGP
jgi:hypothetical protein